MGKSTYFSKEAFAPLLQIRVGQVREFTEVNKRIRFSIFQLKIFPAKYETIT